MLLPRIELTHQDILAEFDQWVTPTLGDIRDTERFQAEASRLASLLSKIANRATTLNLDIASAFKAEVSSILSITDPLECSRLLNDAISALFLVTAKSDNAIKCQFPIHLKGSRFIYPVARADKVEETEVPKVLKATDLVTRIVAVKSADITRARILLDAYVDFLLSDPRDVYQLAALATAHAATSDHPGATSLIAPLIAFQVRGSVAASGGHEPERIVRQALAEWGLVSNDYFNLSDATAVQLNNWLATNEPLSGRSLMASTGGKTRAFDFIFPYQLEFPGHRIFVQSQFYAGDAGSVSHKNVDQAINARRHAQALFTDAWFVEYVDGAGYCGSLRRDLMHLIFASDTYDFYQIRSIPIRLRRVMQESGLFSPLDIALLVSSGLTAPGKLLSTISSAGVSYTESTISRLISLGWLDYDEGDMLQVADGRLDVVAIYSLLDRYVAAGSELPLTIDRTEPYVIFPGFGADYGAKSLQADYPVEHAILLARGYIAEAH